jgi:hypothetical protein
MGLKLRASHLLGKCTTTWAILLVLFALVIFEIESHFMPQINLASSYLCFQQ